jgi:hypothetical protein
MLAAGIDDCTWSQLRQAAEEVRRHIAHAGINGGRLTNAITRLREIACDMARELLKTIEKSATHQRALSVARRVALGVGGAAMIGVDASSLAATIGLSAPGAAVSAAVGGGLLMRGVEPPKE